MTCATATPKPKAATTPPAEPAPDRFTRYQVNVLVDQSATTGAPLVVETNPTFMNLVGRIERDVRLGDNVLDFTMLRAGALQRANGGYLVLRAPDALKDPGVWEVLKRALNTGQIVIEDPGTQLQMFSTRTLESEPIPLNVKVILLGTPWLYYELYDHDEDFHKLFKVKADFATDMERTPENERSYALFVRARCAEHNLPPFDAGAVAAIIEQGSWLAEDQQKLSTRFGEVADVVIEAAHWAGKNHRDVVTAEDVRQALREWRYRSNLIEQQTHESIIDGTITVQVKGSAIGQINGLSVVDYPQALGLGLIFGRDIFLGKCAGKVIGVAVGLHPDQVDYPGEGLRAAQRDLHRYPAGLERLFHVVYGAEEIGVLPVHLVDEGDARDLELVGPLPDIFGLDLHPGDGGEDDHGPAQCTHAGAGIGNEVAVAGGIDDMHRMVVPFAVVQRGGHRYLSLDFLGLVIQVGRAVIDPSETVGHPRRKKNRLGEGGFAGPAMGDNSNISQFCGVVLCHTTPFSYNQVRPGSR